MNKIYNIKEINGDTVLTTKSELLRVSSIVSDTTFIGDFRTEDGRLVSMICSESQEAAQ